jgi:hypothetical protein
MPTGRARSGTPQAEEEPDALTTPFVQDEGQESEASTPTVVEKPVHTLDSLARMISTVVSQNHSIVQKFDGVHCTLRQHADDIRRMDQRIEEGEKKMTERMETLLDSRLADFQGRMESSSISHAPQASTSKKARESEAYWLARRSLRVAPVEGTDLKQGVVEYAEKILMTDPSIVRSLQPSAFRRPPTNRNSAVKEEVVITFANLHDRDYFKSLAFKLAGKKEHSIRLELPGHLLGQHRVLGKAGQELRSGQTGCRTVIRFDDDNMRLVLDYKIQNDQWKRLCPDQAATAVGTGANLQSIQETSAEDFRGLLRHNPSPATGANATGIGQ